MSKANRLYKHGSRRSTIACATHAGRRSKSDGAAKDTEAVDPYRSSTAHRETALFISMIAWDINQEQSKMLWLRHYRIRWACYRVTHAPLQPNPSERHDVFQGYLAT